MAPPGTVNTPKGKRDWKSYFGRTIVLVLAISLAIHVLFLLAFGSVAIFKGSMPKLPFVSQEIATETVGETPPPPPEETTPVEETTMDPFAKEVPESSAAEESAPALDMLTVVGGANWAPTIPKNAPVSETGVIGGTGKGTGQGTGKGPGGPVSGKQLFGVTIQARKLGVIVSINKAAQNSGRLPAIFDEIFKEFPDSPVFLTNGGGMRDWEVAEDEFNKKVEENNKKRKAGESYDKMLTPNAKMKKPEAGRFNTGAALDWVVVRGFKPDPDYPGLKEKHPDLFQDLRRRPDIWFISSNKEADGAYLAFEELIKKRVEAIYWYNQFDRPIEGKAAEEVAQKIADSKIEILVQNQGSKTQGREWLDKVGAKFVK